MKYRIRQHGGGFYPEFRDWFIWHPIRDGDWDDPVYFSCKAGAVSAIELHIRHSTKVNGVKKDATVYHEYP